MPDLYIRVMQSTDLQFAAALTEAEGWQSETLLEIKALFQHDPAGCFVAEMKNRKVGMCLATGYDTFGFVGELIVAPEARGQGVGQQLMERAVRYLGNGGRQPVLLDGVAAAVPLYERLGFRRVCRSLRFAGRLLGKVEGRVRPLMSRDLDEVMELDRRAFGADRSFFIRHRLHCYPKLCRVLVEAGQIKGFVLGRSGRGCIWLGPWVMAAGTVPDVGLLRSLAHDLGDVEFTTGVLEMNEPAVAALQSLGLAAVVNPPWRMVLGRSGETLPEMAGEPTGATEYAIGSASKG